ncbi:hypothetical protein Amet_0535 [Alkaliphilus metalliredigens QYMF]|uniref:PrcB C-terminal domain-containing protein n=1 Tax=Alkaliphilus metalliredigens (strain QYMF) TaxID=293826 RepID=A6TKP4_ALKMQ|nr:Gmad2 immunoglobulin-like domain-containing protein [Alkaliphilus metalliredigens]ABR46762.1 hypothetical protein Amet_0535 [Alkaliphilus metalliredigens QYMF]
MKKILFLIISALLIFALLGCAQESEPPPPEEPIEEEDVIDNGESEEVVPDEAHTIEDNLKDDIEIFGEEEVLEEAGEWFAQFDEAEEGAYVYQHPDMTYIKINAGERRTGGYGIHVKDYDEDAYPRLVTIEIREPGEDEMVTQALTYPSIILGIESEMASQYEVQTVDGNVFDLEDKLVFAKFEMPEADEEIDNPVPVKGKIIAFEGAFVLRILDDEEELIHEEHLQADTGGPNWGSFDEEIEYPEPETQGGSLEIGEYSAKDGEYIMREKISVKFNK